MNKIPSSIYNVFFARLHCIYEGAVKRVRPKLMTVFAILAGLFPIMINHGVGSEVMQRIAAPMIGGIVTSAVVSLILIPILYQMVMQRKLQRGEPLL